MRVADHSRSCWRQAHPHEFWPPHGCQTLLHRRGGEHLGQQICLFGVDDVRAGGVASEREKLIEFCWLFFDNRNGNTVLIFPPAASIHEAPLPSGLAYLLQCKSLVSSALTFTQPVSRT